MNRKLPAFSLAAALGLLTINTASASLILVGPNPDSGQGLGAVQTILTLNNTNGVSSGCVGPGTSTSGCGFANATVQSGANTTTRDITGVSAASLRFVFNGNEPGNDNLVTLNELVANFYANNSLIFSSTGVRLANGTLVAPGTGIDFNPFSGTGNSGYLFRLTTAADGIQGDDQAGALAAAIAAALLQTPGAAITVGLGARTSNAQGGLETFSLRVLTTPGGPSDTPIPEPSTYALMGLGLVAVGLFRRQSAR